MLSRVWLFVAPGTVARQIPLSMGLPRKEYWSAAHFILYSIYFFPFSLLEYNCFTMLCEFLLYNEVNQTHAYTYPLPLDPPSQHSPPACLDHHTVPGWASCALSWVPLTMYFTHSIVHISIPVSQLIPLSHSPHDQCWVSTSASLFLSWK